MTAIGYHPRSEHFRELGFLGPERIFSQAQCRLITTYLRSAEPRPVPTWDKSRAEVERFIFNLATRPRLLAILRDILGEDLILWGSSVVEREVGHPWRTDIETSGSIGRFVSVWIGLENTGAASSLKFVARSHLADHPMQLEAYERGVRNGAATDEMVREWASSHHAGAAIVRPEIADGEAVFFDGRIWNGCDNARSAGRVAVLLQYASAATPVFIPDVASLEWPLRFKTDPRPPVLVISGTAGNDTNRIAPPPPPSESSAALPPMFAMPIRPALPLDGAVNWVPVHFFAAPTAGLDEMECHASILAPGHSPHPPHQHIEEEILAVVSGEAELVLPDPAGPESITTRRLGPGAFAYYPAYRPHTIRNPGPDPVVYLMLKWRGAPLEHDTVMQTQFWQDAPAVDTPNGPMTMRLIFEGRTSFLDRLHAHLTLLEPGAGYPSHRDEHEVAILLLAGSIEINGVVHDAPSLVYVPGGAPHDMRNVGAEPARYLVFEFAVQESVSEFADGDFAAAPASAAPALEQASAQRQPASQVASGDFALELARKVRGLERVLAEKNRRITMLEATISALYSSTSWRVSGPLRIVGRLLGPLRKGGRADR